MNLGRGKFAPVGHTCDCRSGDWKQFKYPGKESKDNSIVLE